MTELKLMDREIGNDENCWLCLEPVDNVFVSGVQIFNCPHKICYECSKSFDYKYGPTSRCGVCRQSENCPADNLFNHPFVRAYCDARIQERDLLLIKISELEEKLKQKNSANTVPIVSSSRMTKFELQKGEVWSVRNVLPIFLGDNQGRDITGEIDIEIYRNVVGPYTSGPSASIYEILENGENCRRMMPRCIPPGENNAYKAKFNTIPRGEWYIDTQHEANLEMEEPEENVMIEVKGDSREFVYLKSSHKITATRRGHSGIGLDQNARTKTLLEAGRWYRKRILRTQQGLEYLQLDNTWRFLNIPAFYFNYN